MSSTDN